MSNISPGITMPGIPSAGAFGYAPTQDVSVYDQTTHAGVPDLGGAPPSGMYVIPSGAITTIALSNNAAQGGILLVPQGFTVSNIGINITVAGDASAVMNLSLYIKTPRQNLYTQVLPEVALNVGTATGIQQTAINKALAAGRYIYLVRATASVTIPTISARTNSAGWYYFAVDSVEATTDASRGGVHPSTIVGYAGSGVPPTSFSLQSGSRSTAPTVFLQAA